VRGDLIDIYDIMTAWIEWIGRVFFPGSKGHRLKMEVGTFKRRVRGGVFFSQRAMNDWKALPEEAVEEEASG